MTTASVIETLLGSTHVFSKAINEVLEDEILRELAGERITASQLTVLKLLVQTEARTVSDVGAFLGVSNAAASKAVDRLVRRKLIHRTEAEADRRASELTLTAAGRELLALYNAGRAQALERTFQNFPALELRAAAELLEQLASSLVNGSGRPDEICLQCYAHGHKRCIVKSPMRDCLDAARKRSRQKPRTLEDSSSSNSE